MIRSIRETCSGKTRYADKRAAKTALNSFQTSRRRSKRRAHYDPKELSIYYCDRCNGWHLTHREDWNA